MRGGGSRARRIVESDLAAREREATVHGVERRRELEVDLAVGGIEDQDSLRAESRMGGEEREPDESGVNGGLQGVPPRRP